MQAPPLPLRGRIWYNAQRKGGLSVNDTETTRRVLVIGGGAGGLCAAVAAARAGCAVTILEKAGRVGKKILKTGNGRCNLSNRKASPAYYNHPEFVAPVLNRTDCEALLDFFASLGLWTVTDAEGRVYPLSDTAASVLDVLRLECARLGVTEVCSAEVTAIRPRKAGGFSVRTREGGAFDADRVVAASGGGTELLRPLGHETVPFAPVLCPLRTDADSIRGLSGLRVKCRAALRRSGETVTQDRGELLFRDFGVSGILALDLSRKAEAGDELSLDLLPDCSPEELLKRLEIQASLRSEREQLLTGVFHRRLAEALLRRTDGEPAALARTVKDYRLRVLGPGDVRNAQVTRGGAAVEGFDPATLESRLCPGLYCVGEALDVDGACGGFNLHWAFASGLAAGRSAAI